MISKLQRENEALKKRLAQSLKETDRVRRQLSLVMQTGSTSSKFAQEAAASWVRG